MTELNSRAGEQPNVNRSQDHTTSEQPFNLKVDGRILDRMAEEMTLPADVRAAGRDAVRQHVAAWLHAMAQFPMPVKIEVVDIAA